MKHFYKVISRYQSKFCKGNTFIINTFPSTYSTFFWLVKIKGTWNVNYFLVLVSLNKLYKDNVHHYVREWYFNHFPCMLLNAHSHKIPRVHFDLKYNLQCISSDQFHILFYIQYITTGLQFKFFFAYKNTLPCWIRDPFLQFYLDISAHIKIIR